LFIVAFLQVFFLQNSFALLDEDQENENPSVIPSKKSSIPAKRLNSKGKALQKTPLKRGSKASAADSPGTTENPSSLSPYSRLNEELSPVRNVFACLLVENGSVSPNSIKETYEKYAPGLTKKRVWVDTQLFDKEKSLPKMKKGKSGVSCKGHVMHLHHHGQTKDSVLICMPDIIHFSKNCYIVVEKQLKLQKTKIVRTRLTRKEAHDLAKTSENYVVVGNVLHPYRNGRSLINRTKFSAKRRSINKKIAKKISFNEVLAPLS
jgi:hypothetical protein